MRWPKFSKASLDRACQEFQSTRCTSSSSMSKIPINEVLFVSKHFKNSNQQEFQSTRCASSPSKLPCSKLQFQRIPVTTRDTHTRLPKGRQVFKGPHREGWMKLMTNDKWHQQVNVKSSNQRGVLCLHVCQEFQSTRCTSVSGCISCPNMSRIPLNEATRCTSSPSRGKARNL